MIFHSLQEETSHSLAVPDRRKTLSMDESTTFKRNLLRLMAEQGLSAAVLSRKAGLNARAVKDIEEGRVQSPKLSTVFKLSQALGVDPGEMMGLGPRTRIQRDLSHFLSQYDEDEQAQLLDALRALRAPRDEAK